MPHKNQRFTIDIGTIGISDRVASAMAASGRQRPVSSDAWIASMLSASLASGGGRPIFANQELWNKYSFLTTLAAGTCLMRASVGTIVASENGSEFMRALYRECLAVAEAAAQPISPETQAIALDTLTQAGSPVTASMLRDLESGQKVEAAHIVGDMLHRASKTDLAAPLLNAAWCHLQAYEAARVG